VPSFKNFREGWVRPALFFGNNPISLIGGALTTAAGLTLVGFWIVDILGRGGSTNPYLGILVDLILPGVFVLGLLLIPVGMWLHRRRLRLQGQLPAAYPQINLADPIFRRGVEFVLAATFVNFILVGTASYRGVAYMDSPNFCGAACHVMYPEYTAYQLGPHSHVACTDCHIGSGVGSAVKAKVNGTKQLIEVVFHRYPTPIPSPVESLRPAREICESCHTPAKFAGEKLIVKTSFADDEHNSKTQSIVLLHLGGRDSLGNLTGIHGIHIGHIEYIATDRERSTIPWVSHRNADGSETVYATSAAGSGIPQGERRTMDCIDCHNRAAHAFVTPEEALNNAMSVGAISPQIPWIHKEGLELIKASYASEDEAREKIPAQLEAFYRSSHPEVLASQGALVKAAGQQLVTVYSQNVFPFMKVTWGTHPNNIGHMNYPGCFRCHDGDHTNKAKASDSIPNDCSTCHNLLAVDEPNPKILSEIGMQ
jgi:nitrate/TMAO reductase-like tetraheme cytochrome c subunit